MDVNPSPTSSDITELIISPAIILILALGLFVTAVITLLCIRKIIIWRCGTMIVQPQWLQHCKAIKCCTCTTNSNNFCIGLAERFDCQTPDTNIWLDKICPSKAQCGEFWNKVISCGCCHSLAESCKRINICPESSGPFQCPGFSSCPCSCQCQCTRPECKEINCGCFTIQCNQAVT